MTTNDNLGPLEFFTVIILESVPFGASSKTRVRGSNPEASFALGTRGRALFYFRRRLLALDVLRSLLLVFALLGW